LLVLDPIRRRDDNGVMLAPKFSLRWMFAASAVCAVFVLIVSWGVQGSHWATGVSTVVFMLALAIASYAVWFGLAWLVATAAATLQRRRSSDDTTSSQTP
jgi:hypothetical protein